MTGPYLFGMHVNLTNSFAKNNLDTSDDVQPLIQSKTHLLDQLMP